MSALTIHTAPGISLRDDWEGNPLGLDCIVRGDHGYVIRRVKDLGWLLKHASEVDGFTIRFPAYTEPGYVNRERPTPSNCYMIAHLTDGRTFETSWADASLCRNWIKRPLFRALPLLWYGEPSVC